MAEVRKARIAEADLDEIWDYIAKDNPDAADGLIRDIETTCRRIARAPLLRRRRNELKVGIRTFAMGNCVIFYQPEEAGILVLRVLHGARDIEAAFES
jgi:toxin ParE1/3/4